MDAAVDAMLPYGFPEEKVKKHVKELLQVYGGEEGWPFIEELSYKVLLESILEAKDDDDEQEQVVQNGHLLEDMSCVDEEAGPPADMLPSNGLESSGAAVAEAGPPEMIPSNILESSGAAVAEAGPPEMIPSNILESSGAAVAEAGPPEMIPSNILVFSGAAVAEPRPRRLPCYGWIDSDEDELNDDDFIILPPMFTATEARETLDVSKWTKNRRSSRWDLKPNDP